MSTYALENWYDYEMNGKLTFSLLESVIESEIDQFNSICEAVGVCKESGIVVSINEAELKEKVKAILQKIKDAFETLVEKIREFLKNIKSKFTKESLKNKKPISRNFIIPSGDIIIEDSNGKEVTSEKNIDILEYIKNMTSHAKMQGFPGHYHSISFQYSDNGMIKKNSLDPDQLASEVMNYIEKIEEVQKNTLSVAEATNVRLTAIMRKDIEARENGETLDELSKQIKDDFMATLNIVRAFNMQASRLTMQVINLNYIGK